jgi:ATP-dependent Lon protease
VPFDLSKTIFILTSNDVSNIPAVLKNRVDILPLPGYTEEEKLVIAKKYLLPDVIKENGFQGEEISFTDEVIRTIIRDYTRETGVRELKRVLEQICRRQIRYLLEDRRSFTKISNHNLHHYLSYFYKKSGEMDQISQEGIAYGTRWAPEGNSLLRIESAVMKGNGQLVISSNLSEALSKLAKTILGYLRRQETEFHLSAESFSQTDIYINFNNDILEKDIQAVALPLALSMISALLGKKIKNGFIFMGAISLKGELLRIDDAEERIIAAAFNNPRKIIIPEVNKEFLPGIEEKFKRVDICFCQNLQQVLAMALE